MKLFWKIFFSLFISFVVIVSSLSYIISVKQISDMEKGVIEDHEIIGSFLSKEIEVGYFESRWPFESLKKLSERKEVLFWWIVKDDGTIHLADNFSFMGTYAQDYFPQIASLAEKETISLNRNQNYAIFFKFLETGTKKWSFWFGFSMKQVSERRKEIIFLITAISMAVLVTLGVILYFAMKHFTKPIQELSVGAAAIGKGDLTYRVRIKSQDELGQLANSFNKMADNLKESQNYLLAEITERKRAEEALQKSEKTAKRLAQENTIVAEIGRIISSTLDIEEVYERFAEEARKLIPFDGIAINIINHKEGTVTVPYVSGIDVPGCQPGDVFPLEGSVTGEVVRTHSGVIIQTRDRNELQTCFPTLLTAFNTGLRSVIAVPLISKDQVIGAIHFRSSKPYAYSDQDLKLAESIGSQIAGAIANAQLFNEQKQAEEIIRESEKRYRQVVENAAEIIYTTDENGKFSFANSSALKIAGYSFEEFQRLNCLDLVVPEHRDRLVETYARMFRENQTTTYVEFPFFTKSQEVVWLGQNISFLIENEKIIGFHNIGHDITERKQAKEMLSQSEERFKKVAESAGEWIWEVDVNGLYTYASPVVEKILGFKPEEIVGKKYFYDFITPDVREELKKAAFEVFAKKEPFRKFLNPNVNKNGNIVFLKTSGTPIVDNNGTLLGYRGADTDVTERKRAEEALKESEEKYRTILENIEDGYFEVDIAGNVTFCNDSLCLIWGYPKEELIGKNYRDSTDQENANKLFQAFNKVYKTGEPTKGFDYEIIRKDGMKISINTSVSLIRDVSGKPIGFRGIIRDITERKRAEEFLRESEERYRNILNNIEDGYYELDIAGNFTFFNNSLYKILGYPKEELMGMNNRVYMDKETARRVYQAYNQVYTTGEPLKAFGYKIIRKDGIERFLESHVSLLTSAKGEQIGFRGIARDMTEPKQAEENLKESEEKYRLLVEESLQGIVVAQGFPPRLVFANPAMTMILGYTFEEFLSLSPQEIEDLVHPEDRAFFFKNYKDRLEGKLAPPRYEIRGVRKDGTVVWLDLSSTHIEYKGHPAVQAAFLDITERKRAEEALRESEERYRTILENIEDGYYEVDLPGNFTFFNDSLSRMLGYSRDEMIGMGNQRYTDPENSKKLFQAFNEVYRTGEPVKGFDWEVIKKDGTKVFGEVSVSPIKDSKGQPIGFRGIARDITERKRAVEEIKHTLSLLNATLESTADGILVVDREGKIESFNRKFVQMWHIPESIIASQNDDQALAFVLDQLKDPEGFFAKVRELYNQPAAESFDLLEFKDGRFFERYSLPQWIGEQSVGRVWSFRDVTERKKAEEALRTEKLRFQTLSEDAPFGMVMIDQDGTFKYMNPKFRELLGYDLTDIPDGKTWFRKAYPNPTYRHDVIEAWINDLKSSKPGEKRSQIFTVTCKDGTEKTINFIPVQLETGENLMACEDITERMMAGEALKKSEVRFQELFNDAPVGYFEYDVEGRIIDANRTELEMLGYTRKEMIGQPVWKFVAEEEVAHRQVLEKLAGTLPPARGLERVYRRKDGTTFPALIEDRLHKDSEGKFIGMRTTIQDITQRKQAEEEMKELEEQFRQSQKMEAVGRLGGGIAHDFNNLLTIIKGYSQLSLLDLKESDPLWGNIQEIQKATQRATDLTRQLLAFSRRQILDLKVLDMNTLLRDLDKMLRRIIGEDIELVTLLSGDLGRVKIDPGQIEQVIFNLAVNARDAMPSGGKLLIETTNVELDKEYANAHIGVVPGRYVKLSVSDTGIGMSQEVREKVFEPFFTTKDKGKGTGLGLSTVYGIVKQSGGNIWVYSEPGHGTTFKIYLPKVEEELDTLHGRDETEFSPRGSETVLLVEDEQEVRLLAHRLLSQQGYRVLEATNGEEALYVAQEQGGEEIHLLLTDVVMPQMGGKELADQLKILRPDIKVLYTSGYTDDAIVHHGVLESGTHFLQKPFSPKTLSHKVREVLDR